MTANDCKCLNCGSNEFECIHKGTRDNADIDELRCSKCGLVQLSSKDCNTEQDYSDGGMLREAYNVQVNKVENKTWETWIDETRKDDDRRYRALRDVCRGKSILEFGCGNGGFLRRIRGEAARAVGIELMDKARDNIAKDGIEVYKSLSAINGKYDVVCMFMVIEHLNNPDRMLEDLYGIMNPGGILVCETPNADDALISKYRCKAFEDFTYWSKHVVLFNSDTLLSVMERNGFRVKSNTQIQRYSLSNHLYWLAERKPGGHMKWNEFNGKELNDAYAAELVGLGLADTLWYVGIKGHAEV